MGTHCVFRLEICSFATAFYRKHVLPLHLPLKRQKTGVNKVTSASNIAKLVPLFTPVLQILYLYVPVCTRLTVLSTYEQAHFDLQI